VQRGRAGGECQCIRRADRNGELGLERIHSPGGDSRYRPEGRDPVRRKDLLDELLLQAGHVGRREVDAGQGQPVPLAKPVSSLVSRNAS
jgi:hypothetical protein